MWKDVSNVLFLTNPQRRLTSVWALNRCHSCCLWQSQEFRTLAPPLHPSCRNCGTAVSQETNETIDINIMWCNVTWCHVMRCDMRWGEVMLYVMTCDDVYGEMCVKNHPAQGCKLHLHLLNHSPRSTYCGADLDFTWFYQVRHSWTRSFQFSVCNTCLTRPLATAPSPTVVQMQRLRSICAPGRRQHWKSLELRNAWCNLFMYAHMYIASHHLTLCYIALHWTALHYTVALHCIALRCIAVHYIYIYTLIYIYILYIL